MEQYNEQELKEELRNIDLSLHKKYIYFRPYLLLASSTKISYWKDYLEGIKQNMEVKLQISQGEKMTLENLDRHIRYLQSKLDIVDHNFIFFSAFVSLTMGVISIITTMYPTLSSIIKRLAS